MTSRKSMYCTRRLMGKVLLVGTVDLTSPKTGVNWTEVWKVFSCHVYEVVNTVIHHQASLKLFLNYQDLLLISFLDFTNQAKPTPQHCSRLIISFNIFLYTPSGTVIGTGGMRVNETNGIPTFMRPPSQCNNESTNRGVGVPRQCEAVEWRRRWWGYRH